MTIRVAAAQLTAGLDKDTNLKVVRDAVCEAAEGGAELVLTPENSMYTDPAKENDDRSYPEPLDGRFVTSLREHARDAGIAVVAGMTEALAGDQRPSNTLVAIDRTGELIGVYRKVHLYDAFGYRESDDVCPAPITDPLVFDLGHIRFGAMTCYDVRFPESARMLADAEATALLVPAAWVAGPAKEDHWLTLLRARAIENTAYVVAADQAGPYCAGQSRIVDPMGTEVAGVGEEVGIAAATLDPARVDAVRRKNPSLTNRRFRVVPR